MPQSPARSRTPCPLRGIVPPLATPLSGRDELDLTGLDRLIEHVLAGGVHGLFILGTTGEGPALSYRLRTEMIQRTCEQVAGRVPVLLGITDTSLVESLQLAEVAADAEADAVVMAPPYYLPFGQSQLVNYTRELVAELPLPLFLYNMPALCKTWFARETLAELLPEPRILGLKDSSGDFAYLRDAVELAKSRPDFTILIGPEALLAEALTFGVHGGVCGGGNVFPEFFVNLCTAYAQDDAMGVAAWQERIERLQGLYRISPHPSAVIQGVKAGLACRGICGDRLAAPVRALVGEDRERADQIIADLEAAVSRTSA
jgi:2-dehydro-3-deoxy-D-pentonate aldolase